MGTNASAPHASSVSFLRVHGLSKRYVRRKSLWRRSTPVVALRDVTFEIASGKTLALVGSSGSGKSTVARCVTRLEKPDAGQIWLGETNISQLRHRDLVPLRPLIQMVFQDSVTSLNPRFTAAEIIEEPLQIQARGNQNEWRDHARELMTEGRS